MKRIFLLATIMLALLGCQIRANEVPAPSSDDLSSVVRRFKGVEGFNAAVSPILDEDNLILEARDDEDLVKIYGIPDEKNPGIIKNIVIFVPSDEVLLKINGSVDVAAIAQYAQ